jgi:tRNA (guanine-N7-)-methyltransferase
MGKDKLRKFAENQLFRHLYQPAAVTDNRDSDLKGRWNTVFGNSNPIVLELGCGKGEYTVALSQKYPDRNFIGVDIKGARLWRGAKTVDEKQIPNAAFLRIRIEFIETYFAEDEIDEIWITFPDPQPNKSRKRLTSPVFLDRYRKILKNGGIVHLKTDSRTLFDYTLKILKDERCTILCACADISERPDDELLSIKTFYETMYSAQGIPVTYLRFALENRQSQNVLQ